MNPIFSEGPLIFVKSCTWQIIYYGDSGLFSIFSVLNRYTLSSSWYMDADALFLKFLVFIFFFCLASQELSLCLHVIGFSQLCGWLCLRPLGPEGFSFLPLDLIGLDSIFSRVQPILKSFLAFSFFWALPDLPWTHAEFPSNIGERELLGLKLVDHMLLASLQIVTPWKRCRIPAPRLFFPREFAVFINMKPWVLPSTWNEFFPLLVVMPLIFLLY